MVARGEADGIAQRVANVEEALRNLQRLPGAVVPPLVPEPVAVTNVTQVVNGVAETLVARVSGSALVTAPGGTEDFALTVDEWLGDDPPTIVPFTSDTDLTVAPGLYAVALRMLPVSGLDPADRWTLTLRAPGTNDLTVARPLGAYDDSGEVDAGIVWHFADSGAGYTDHTVSAFVSASVVADTTFFVSLHLVRLGEALPGVFTGYGP